MYALGAVLTVGPIAAQTVDFQKDVHPVLESRCRMCHVGDDAQAGFRVDSRESMVRGGKSGPGIVPGKPGESLLMRKITGQAGLRMPPSGPPLTDDVVAVLGKWIEAGAPWSATAAANDSVAPIAPRNPPLPAGTRHPVDRLVAAYMAKKGVPAPQPVSDALFARRVYLDLWGLLPTPEQVAGFERDQRSDKRERLVDQLLAGRENYAEHWITFWNDLLRNDEGVAYHGERKSITDWLLNAMRANMPYDQMVRALLDPRSKEDPEGFLTGVTWRGVISASQSPPMQASQNSAQVFLGMNLKCAACHDSFVNRWKLADTYGLAAMFSDDKLELVRCDVKTGRMAEARFPIPSLKVAFEDDSLPSRRAAAAKWFTTPENGRFARTMVNRYWRQLMGRGLVEPVDDMDAAPWDADLLDWLAYDFADHGYDLQHLLRRIMTSQVYQMPAVVEKAAVKEYVFRGPQLRRLTAEQFEDAISSVTGDWRVRTPRDRTHATYTREWRLKSDPLSRALGRPIRDQVYTERSQEATTLQALEMTNGPLLSHRLERGALALLGKLPPQPANLFDSKLLRGGSVPVDVDISGARELWLVVEDVDSYDRSRVLAGWVNAELTGPDGTVKLSDLPAREKFTTREFAMKDSQGPGISAALPAMLSWDLGGRKFTRFRAIAAVDESSRQSDIGPAVRFFVFTEKPETERMVRIEGEAPSQPPDRQWTAGELADRLYRHLMARQASAAEKQEARDLLQAGGSGVTAAGVEDLLWALLMSPEFQFVH